MTNTIKPDRLESLLTDMINIYSPTGKEGEILEFIEDYLRSSNLPVERLYVDEDRYNLIVWPDITGLQCSFLGHIDTVPAFDLDNFQTQKEDNRLYGLGSADMKGGCAAMIEAYISYFEKNHLPPAALVLVVGEEETGDGTKAFLENYNVPWSIVGEPTANKPCLAHYGYLELELNTWGKRLHASLSNWEHNAINKQLNTLLAVVSYLENERQGTIYNIRDIYSSEAGFSVPDRCSANLDIHVPPSAKLEDIIFEIEDVVKAQLKLDQLNSETISFETIDSGYHLPEKGLLPDILKEVYETNNMPWETDAFRSHSDANLLWASGIKPIILGPGQLAEAHTPTESVSLSQIHEAAGLYYDVLSALNQ